MTSPWESSWMAVGPLKVLRKAAEPPAGDLRRMPITLKPTNHLRRRDGRAFILPSVVGTLRPAALNSEPAICPSSVRRSARPIVAIRLRSPSAQRGCRNTARAPKDRRRGGRPGNGMVAQKTERPPAGFSSRLAKGRGGRWALLVTRGMGEGLPLAHDFLDPARKPRAFLEASELSEIRERQAGKNRLAFADPKRPRSNLADSANSGFGRGLAQGAIFFLTPLGNRVNFSIFGRRVQAQAARLEIAC